MNILVQGLSGVLGLTVQWPVSTNIAFVELAPGIDPQRLHAALADKGVRTLRASLRRPAFTPPLAPVPAAAL